MHIYIVAHLEHIEAGIDLHINANISGKSSKFCRGTALRLALSGMFIIVLICFWYILWYNNISDSDLHADKKPIVGFYALKKLHSMPHTF